jgi:hypothetical protein
VSRDVFDDLIEIAQRLIRSNDPLHRRSLARTTSNLFVGCDAPFGCGAQATINASELFRSRIAFLAGKVRFDIQCDLGEPIFGLTRPSLDARECFGQSLRSNMDVSR